VINAVIVGDIFGDDLEKIVDIAAHPRTVGENYSEHFVASWGLGFSMIVGGLACFVPGLISGLFVTTGSNTICRRHGAMVTNRMRQP
tara:strand:+ start:17833 stop:18093 length:261 start_codon:yes stop_codon:yes gene_type:complete